MKSCPNITHFNDSRGWCWTSSEDQHWNRCFNNDPVNDLNAMHEAEKVLTYEQLPVYIATLKNPVLMKDEGVSDFDLMHSTAAQRAEAFLRTLGLWK